MTRELNRKEIKKGAKMIILKEWLEKYELSDKEIMLFSYMFPNGLDINDETELKKFAKFLFKIDWIAQRVLDFDLYEEYRNRTEFFRFNYKEYVNNLKTSYFKTLECLIFDFLMDFEILKYRKITKKELREKIKEIKDNLKKEFLTASENFTDSFIRITRSYNLKCAKILFEILNKKEE